MNGVSAAKVDETIDELEALANGELDFDTEDTQRFFEHPKVGAKLRTPNGSTILVKRVLRPQCSEYEFVVVAEGKVLKAPQCPKYEQQIVTFLVSQDGAICFAEES